MVAVTAAVTRRQRSGVAANAGVDAVVKCDIHDLPNVPTIDASDKSFQKNNFELLKWNIATWPVDPIKDDRVLYRLFLVVSVKFSDSKTGAMRRKTATNYGDFIEAQFQGAEPLKYFRVTVGEVVQQNQLDGVDEDDAPNPKVVSRKTTTNTTKVLVHINEPKKMHPFNPDIGELLQGSLFYFQFPEEKIFEGPLPSLSLTDASGFLSWLIAFASDANGFDKVQRSTLAAHVLNILTYNPAEHTEFMKQFGIVAQFSLANSRVFFKEFWELTAKSYIGKHGELYKLVAAAIEKEVAVVEVEDDDDDQPLAQAKRAHEGEPAVDGASDSDNDQPLASPKKKTASAPTPSPAKRQKRQLETEDDVEVSNFLTFRVHLG